MLKKAARSCDAMEVADIGRRCQAYRTFLETLSPANLAMLPRLVSPTVRFRDPIHDVRGVENVKRIYASLFDLVDDPRFTVTHCACADDICFLRWHFTCRPRLFGKGHPWILDAVTALHFDAQGRVVEHVDYWDAGQYMYERFRVIGPIFRFFRKRRMRAS